MKCSTNTCPERALCVALFRTFNGRGGAKLRLCGLCLVERAKRATLISIKRLKRAPVMA